MGAKTLCAAILTPTAPCRQVTNWAVIAPDFVQKSQVWLRPFRASLALQQSHRRDEPQPLYHSCLIEMLQQTYARHACHNLTRCPVFGVSQFRVVVDRLTSGEMTLGLRCFTQGSVSRLRSLL